MNIILRFDYYSKMIYIPDGYINNLNKIYLEFFEWLSEQTECCVSEKKTYGLSYDESHFLKYINEELLGECSEKAYVVKNVNCRKGVPVLKF